MPLEPEIAAYLEASQNQPPRSSLDVAATREMMRRAARLAGPAPELPRIDDLTIGGSLRARRYWPTADTDLPLAVYFHGGRFFSGDLDTHDTVCRSLALSGGCEVLAVDYRLAPEHRFPAAVEDACIAVDWALQQSDRVAVAGDSAGANLAAVAAMAHRSSGLRAQVLIYPMIDAVCGLPSHTEYASGYGPGSSDMIRGWREYLPDGTDPRDPRASPLYAEDVRGVAPAFLILAEYDSLRSEGEAYVRTLARAGVTVTERVYPGTIHGFFTMSGISPRAREAVADAGEFLKISLDRVRMR